MSQSTPEMMSQSTPEMKIGAWQMSQSTPEVNIDAWRMSQSTPDTSGKTALESRRGVGEGVSPYVGE